MSKQAANSCAVLVTVEAAAAVMPDLVAHARYGLSRFTDYAGFISGRLHMSADGTRMVQYLLWQTEATYLACIRDPKWDTLESTRRFRDRIQSGDARMDVQTYGIIGQQDPR